MMKKTARGLAIILVGGVAWAAQKFTKEQLAAQYHYDLGPSEVDVSGYPKKQQENYGVFKKTCSQCHTLARPLNSPIVEKSDWQRYVRRMHLRTKFRPGTQIGKQEALAVVSFLAYDAQRRKVERKEEFEAKDSQLRALFEAAVPERQRLQQEEDRKKIKPLPLDGAGEKPRP